MLSSALPEPRKEKLLKLAAEIATYLDQHKYADAERLFKKHLSPNGLISVYPKKGSRPIIEALFFEAPEHFRSLFSAESIKNTKVATVSLFEINTEMVKAVSAKLEQLRDYADVVGSKAVNKQRELLEIYNELQPKLADFKSNVLKIEEEFSEKVQQVVDEIQLSKQPHVERREKTREEALQHREILTEQRATEEELNSLDRQLTHLQSESIDERKLNLKKREDILLLDFDRRRAMQKLPQAEDKLKTLNFKLDIMATLHKHDKTLNEHRSSKYLRGFVNGISLILIGLPWLAHRMVTGKWFFFEKTTSQEKIEEVDRALKLEKVPAQMVYAPK
jgi:hypothetical protein